MVSFPGSPLATRSNVNAVRRWRQCDRTDPPDCPGRRGHAAPLSGHVAPSPLQRRTEGIEQETCAVLARTDVVITVKESALLSDLQRRLRPARLQLHRRQRYRDLFLIQVHHIAVDQALVRNHVVVEGVKGGHDATFPTALRPLGTAYTDVHMPFQQLPPFRWPAEPLRLRRLIRECLPYSRDWCVVGALQVEHRMHH